MKFRTADKPWNKRRFLRNIAVALAFGVFVPVQVSAEEVVDAETNVNTLDFLEAVDTFVTAERIPTRRLDTPANVTAITAAEIEANHYQDIAEALNSVNGVVVNGSTIYLNGNSRVVVLMDGRRSSIGIIPSMKNIERIEIVKGGGSALYGTDAVGGVVNIITKKGQFNETTLDFNVGSWHTHRYELTNQGAAGTFSWFVTGNLNRQGYYKYKDGSGEHTSIYGDEDNSGLTIRLDNRLDDSSSITLNYLHSNRNSHYQGTYGAITRGKILRWYLDNDLYVSYNFKEDTSTPGFFSYFNNYSHSDNQGDSSNRFHGFEYQNGWELDENNRLIAGMEWHHSKSDNTRGGIDGRKRINQAYYLQDTMTLDERWTLVPGVRLDHNTSFGTHWSPKFAANYRADDQTKIYATWGHVFQSPGDYDLYYIDSTGLMGHGNPNLDPESGHTETIGVEHDLSDNMSVSFSFFNTELKDVVRWLTPTGRYADYTPLNVDNEKQRGIEVAFRQKINDDWSYNLGYSHTHTELNGVNTNFRQPNGYRVGIQYRHNPWSINLHSVMGSGLNDNSYIVSKYALFDFNANYKIDDWATIYVRANNFTNQYTPIAGRGARYFMTGAEFKF